MASTLLIDNIEDLSVDPVSSAISGNFTYIAYADNTAGSGFTTTFSPSKLYYSIITSTTEIPGLSASNFTGKWLPVPGKDIARNHFTYIAFADQVDGTGFTTVYSDDKEYFAIKISTLALTNPVVGDFVDLWRPMNQYPLTPNYDKVAYLRTDKCHWSTNGMAYSSMSPGAYHYKGTYNRVYFSVMDWRLDANGSVRSGHTVNTTQVGYYDLDVKAFSPLTTIAHMHDTSADAHDIPTLIVSDDGHIIIMQEQLDGSGNHNSPVDVWRSNSVEDISAFTNVATLGTDFAYPNLILGPSQGEVFVFFRYNGGVDHSHLYAVKSSDNGATWAAPYEVANCLNIAGAGLDWYFYPRLVLGKRENGIAICGSLNEGSNGTSTDGTASASRYKIDVYLYSTDGITFGNVKYQFGTTGGFSKDVTASPITPAELLANCTFMDVKAVAYRSIDIIDAGMDGNGIPYVFVREWSRYNGSVNPDYAFKDNMIINDHIWYFNPTTNLWVDVIITDVANESYEVASADANTGALRGSRCLINVHSNGVIDYITRRCYVKDDFYKPPYAAIDAAAKGLRGGIFKVAAIGTPGTFGEGVVANDFYSYGSTTPAFDASNTLLPIEEEIVFFRTLDKGVTWSEIREPLYIRGFNYATQLPITTAINNNQDHGISGVFLGIPKPIPGGLAYDHSELALVWDKVRI
jgi:hypothetical protein